MKIYTKTGDKGKTSLWGGKRVKKFDSRLETYGTIDELNALLGVANSDIKDPEIKKIIIGLQNDLFNVGSDLATPFEGINENMKVVRVKKPEIINLENLIDDFNARLPELGEFILPGGNKGAATLQLARTVCRRAERLAVKLAEKEKIGNFVIIYLNRLSDFLFVLSRYENFLSKTPEPTWKQNFSW